MRRAIKVLEEAGKPFGGFRLHPDGAVDILTASTEPAASSNPLDQELADWMAQNGNGGPDARP